MTSLAWFAARLRRIGARLAVGGRRAPPWWLILSLLLAACGGAAAPLGSATSTALMAVAAPTSLVRPVSPEHTVTLIPTATLSPAETASPGAHLTAAASPQLPSRTPLPTASATPSAQPKAQPTLGAFSITPLAGATLVTPNPTAVSAQTVNNSVVNIVLIGTDLRPTDATFRTDTLIVVSINKDAGTVSLLSIPRDLFVYIPTWGMDRINRAFQLADGLNYPGGGPALLEQTILYNLGVPIQYYALVDFSAFRKVVDTLGGVDLPVNCQVTEYKIKDPTLDERVAANYALYTQPVGVAHMDGALALWYARARPVGGDFFRGYRQRQVLRAMYHAALRADMLPHIPALYAELRNVVQTDLGLLDITQFVPLVTHLDDSLIRSFNIGPNQTTGWTTPGGDEVLLPNGGAIETLVGEFFASPTNNRLAQPLTWVEITNGATGTGGQALAAETLHNEGFGVELGNPDTAHSDYTTIVDHTISAKGSSLKRLQAILHVDDQHVVAQPDGNSPVQFQVNLGSDYNSCPRLDWMDNSVTPTPAH
jgi:LCP family protein required for cell wall assembly